MIETPETKMYFSESLNYFFNKKTGYTEIWGVNREHNPDFSEKFPMILDFEITTKCSGINGKPCKECYKSNTLQGDNISFEDAKTIIDKMPKELTQIAFGTDSNLTQNPDWFKIFSYARESGYIPNVTIAQLDIETAKKLASVCGAVAVSNHHNKDVCYDTVKLLSDSGMKQVNIHEILSEEGYEETLKLIEDIKKDPRLSGLNAVVFLSLKKKGRGINFHQLTFEKFKKIIDKCMELGINYGFDSCSAHKFMKCIEGTDKEYLKQYCEPCECTCFSSYINVHGEYFPCSFCEGTKGWETGLDVLHCNDFTDDIWVHPKTCLMRERLLMDNRHCPIYNI